jgi:signal transduction histidine kinase
MLSDAVETTSGLYRQEVQVDTSSGTRTLGLTGHALRRDDGTVRGHLVLFVDLTASQKEAEARQLATSLAQLGELAAGVAHELRNSLATLRGYLQLIERKPDEESITDYLSEIRRESDHLQRVLEDFLSFARPDSRRVESVDLLSVVRSAAADPALGDKRVEIEADESIPYSIPGDAQLLERAFRNLLHNAARAEADAGYTGAVRVEIERLPAEVDVSIRDRGDGLPAPVRDRLFQPFVTGRPDGVGLGLSLTHRIVTLHGGRIELEDRPGGGTEAHLSFPTEAPD